jgi:hypothetical protein
VRTGFDFTSIAPQAQPAVTTPSLRGARRGKNQSAVRHLYGGTIGTPNGNERAGLRDRHRNGIVLISGIR